MESKVKKPKGRRSPYNYFVRDYQKQLKEKNSTITFEKSSKLCAAKWKHLSQEVKEKYRKMAEADARRYKKEMGKLTKRQLQALKMKKRKKKDPTAPVRPLTAYMWFCKTQWKNIAKKHPRKSFMEIRKRLTGLWKECSPEEKSKYETMAEYDRKCYQMEKNRYMRQKKTQKKP